MTAPDNAAADHGHPVDPERVRAARPRLISDQDAQRLASLLGLLADPIRARIVYALDTVQELCVGDIPLVLQASEDATGYGLRILRTAGLVATRRQGRIVYCRLADRLPGAAARALPTQAGGAQPPRHRHRLSRRSIPAQRSRTPLTTSYTTPAATPNARVAAAASTAMVAAGRSRSLSLGKAPGRPVKVGRSQRR